MPGASTRVRATIFDHDHSVDQHEFDSPGKEHGLIVRSAIVHALQVEHRDVRPRPLTEHPSPFKAHAGGWP